MVLTMGQGKNKHTSPSTCTPSNYILSLCIPGLIFVFMDGMCGECVGSWWGKPEGKRPLGRSRRRWVDNIRMDLQKVGCGYMDWIGLAQDRDRWRTLVSAVMNFRVP